MRAHLQGGQVLNIEPVVWPLAVVIVVVFSNDGPAGQMLQIPDTAHADSFLEILHYNIVNPIS